MKGKPAGKHTCHCDGKGKTPAKGGSGNRMALIIGIAKPKKGASK